MGFFPTCHSHTAGVDQICCLHRKCRSSRPCCSTGGRHPGAAQEQRRGEVRRCPSSLKLIISGSCCWPAFGKCLSHIHWHLCCCAVPSAGMVWSSISSPPQPTPSRPSMPSCCQRRLGGWRRLGGGWGNLLLCICVYQRKGESGSSISLRDLCPMLAAFCSGHRELAARVCCTLDSGPHAGSRCAGRPEDLMIAYYYSTALSIRKSIALCPCS